MRNSLRRILAIFRKDVRRHWPHLLIFASLLAVAAAARTTGYEFYLESFALPLACCSILALAIHEDRLVGDGQYWLARPYDWRELFAAKALFVLVCVQLPVVLQQAVVLMGAGISPAAHWKPLLENQLALGIFLLLPAAAVAAVTRNLGQMVLSTLLISLALFWFVFLRPGLYVGGLRFFLTPRAALIIVAGAVAALLMQYWRRRTPLGRATIGTAVLVLLLAASRERAVARFYKAIEWRDDVRITLDPAPSRRAHAPASGFSAPVRVDIPILLTGLSSDVDVATDDIALGLRGPGIPLGSAANRENGIRRDPDGQTWLIAYIKPTDFESAGDKPVDLYGSMELTTFRNRWTAPLPPGGAVTVPGVGICRDDRRWSRHSVECLTPKPAAAVQFESWRGEAGWVISPEAITGHLVRPAFGRFVSDHAMMRLSTRPLVDFRGFGVLTSFYNWGFIYDDSGENRLIVRTPVDHFRVAFNLNSLRLRDYVKLAE